jgi:hypothetical protein
MPWFMWGLSEDIPCEMRAKYVCDGDHGLFGPVEMEADVTYTYPRDAARDAGWYIDPNGPVYCPECARKR